MGRYAFNVTDGTLITNGNTLMISRSPDFWLMGLTIDPATSTLFSLACYSQKIVSLFSLNSTDGRWYWLSQNSWKADACYNPTKPSGLFSFTVGDALRLGFTWRDESKGDSVYIVDGTTGELIKTLPPSTTCPFITTLKQY